jgi:XTP/dITP diphosphohydrolase
MTPAPAARRLVCASANPDKVAEIEAILAGTGVDLLPRPPEVPDVVEDAPTLAGNARLKAAAIAAATGLAAVADDTGLEVDALDGAPGVRTARYAGEQATYAENRAKLLAALDGVPAAQRTARFRTVVTIVDPDGPDVSVDGVCDGFISLTERGERGFGYDAVFVPGDDPAGPTFAEMSEDAKHAVSHRGRALRSLLTALSD